MADNETHLLEKGKIFEISFTHSGTAVDLSGVDTTTSRIIYFQPPKDSGLDVTSAALDFPTGLSGTSGVVWFTIPTTTFFGVAGIWRMQARFNIAGNILYSDAQTFEVKQNLPL